MTKRKRIGLRDIATLGPSQTIWDTDVSCFGARRQKSNAVSYVVFCRTAESRQRFHTIGRHGAPWTPETARKEARRILGNVASGKDPAGDKKKARRAESVSALCDLYFADAEAGRILTRRKKPKKSSTIATDRSRVERHIKPLLGLRSVASVTRADIESFMHSVAEEKRPSEPRPQRSVACRLCVVGEVLLHGRLAFWAQYFRTQSDKACAPIIQFEESNALPTASASDGSAKTSMPWSEKPCERRRQTLYGHLQSPLRIS
jgi:Arm DNA-binding domain